MSEMFSRIISVEKINFVVLDERSLVDIERCSNKLNRLVWLEKDLASE